MKVHLVDGTYELFRAFYGAPEATAPDGREVGATRALLASFVALLTAEGATHVAVAFDHVIESFRNDLFDGYKTGAGIDPALYGQFHLAERATAALGITVWSMVEFEADDALATGAYRYADDERVEQVVLCSPDKDLAQCVRGDRVVLNDRRRKKIYDEAGVHEKYGVLPASIPDWLALVGDDADGIPGIPRWGAKSSAAVLADYPHLDQIPKLPGQWKSKVRGATTLAANLDERRDDALLYRTLATLRTDVPLAESVDDLEWRGADRATFTALAEELGDDKIVDRVPKLT
ncbi:MAG: 5'-3' exonuclease H3TH domain-containing protein [Deltaproteobacteria bacterium]